MEANKLQEIEDSTYARDPITQAVISKNRDERSRFLEQRDRERKYNESMARLEQRIVSLEQRVGEIVNALL